MGSMFNGASAFNGDISSWNTAAVTDMGFMFYQASAFNQDLSSWDVMAVTDNVYMWLRNRRGTVPGLFVASISAMMDAMMDEAHKPCTATGVGADGTTSWRICGPFGPFCPFCPCPADWPCTSGDGRLALHKRGALKAAVDSCLAADPTGADCR